MNKLQPLGERCPDLFVTLNPAREIAAERTIAGFRLRTSVVRCGGDAPRSAMLWRLQGERHTWFCGSYFGSGFHEDGLQAGLAVAEDIGGVRRPWRVADESGRIHLRPTVRGPLVATLRGGGRMSAFRSCAYVGTVVHKRLDAAPHAFSYRVFALCLDVDEIDRLAASCGCSRGDAGTC